MFAFLLSTHFAYTQDLTQIKNSKPFTFSGSLTMGSGMNLTSAGTNPYNRNAYNINFAPVIKIYNFSFPFTFYVTNSSRGFNHPFNRVGVSPTWKWLKLHAGYRTLTISPYIFSGRMMLGGGIEMNPGKFRFAFMGGQLAKSQSEDTLSTQNIPTTFERYGFGGKIGVGTSKSYFDFLFFKGNDVVNSISTPTQSTLKAAENAAAGISFSIALSKKLLWQTTAILSAYTRDVNANDSMYSDQLAHNRVIGLNLSSQYLTAGESSIRYTGSKGGITVKYRRIDPDFKTMGLFYMQTDLSEYSLFFNKSLFKSKLSVNGNFLTSNDNIYRMRNTLTSRFSGAMTMNYRVGKKWLINLSAIYAQMKQSYIKQDMGDSLRTDLLNKMLTAGVNYTNDKFAVTKVISFSASYNSFANVNPDYLYDFSSSNISANLSHKTTIKKTKTNFTEQLSVFNNQYGKYNTQSISAGESIGKILYKDKLNTSVGVNYIYTILNENNHKNAVNTRVSISYKPNKNNTFSFSGNFQNNMSAGNNTWFSSFNIRYTLNFNEISATKTETK